MKLSNQDKIFVLEKDTKTKFLTKEYIKKLRFKIGYKIDLLKTGPVNPDYSFFNVNESKSNYSANEILNRISFRPDIIFIHWISWFLNSKVIADLQKQSKARIIWLMMDNSPLTGGCHYPWNCEGFIDDCSNCPAILGVNRKYISQQNLLLKKSNLPDKVDIIACSENDYLKANKSSLFYKKKKHKFLLPVDEILFFPSDDREAIKAQLGIPDNTEKILLCGAVSLSEKRKGFDYLLSALQKLKDFLPPEGRQKIHVVIMGKKLNAPLHIIPFNYSFLGYIPFQDLIKALQVADVFVSPSVEDSWSTDDKSILNVWNPRSII